VTASGNPLQGKWRRSVVSGYFLITMRCRLMVAPSVMHAR
jgi:hypothetical protein